ncbi:substrate-binding domain-containing protein [Pseudobutyrivibrio ruminis]|uniref:Ribose transport system substrate-binding protein n=1 Tax=Pseudobutyrivibrio ruminis DSM 9787 TaxID=1123011 RepID=A0A285RI27_9FIRM|nr:substrate-binding domain-containing protein [Pseudobutyrivibrio ruminis]SOB92007.1 ribose transport system substrate-binding protein [Pseudobutyrivibrio ruminis DSM 9787]
MRRNRFFIGMFLVLILLIIVEFYVYANSSVFEGEDERISFVVTGDNLDDWETLKSGAETAALDNKCQVTFLNSPVSAGVEGEIELINRQIYEGAEYVYVASGYYDELYEYIKEQGLKSKVRFVKNGSCGDDKYSIIADDYSMGKDYGKYIIDDGFSGSLYVMYSSDSVNNLNFIKGLEEAVDGSDVYLKREYVTMDDSSLINHIYNIYKSGLYNGMILLDANVLDCAMSLGVDQKSGFAIYGVDDRQAAVYYLDSGSIQALACKDDYTIGYLAVKAVLNNGDKVSDEGVPLYYIINKEQIYSEEYEKILFPFVK